MLFVKSTADEKVVRQQRQKQIDRITSEFQKVQQSVATVPPQAHSADALFTLFTQFKRQTYCEQVNSQFQGPLAVWPVFLHSPRRIEALMFLMVIALCS